MKIIERRWTDVSRSDEFRLYPLADPHFGAIDCDEKRFAKVVQEIEVDDRAYWVGLGDYCEYINRSDPRYDPMGVADWMHTLDAQIDPAGAQEKRFIEAITPIADKCLGLIEGNHERVIRQKYERDIVSNTASEIKRLAGMDSDQPLVFGVEGWLILKFSRANGKRATTTIRVYLHHGWVGGRLAGAKALNLERTLWNHECDLFFMGHSHVVDTANAWVQRVRGKRVVEEVRKGAVCGGFKGAVTEADTYSQHKGYFPAGPANVWAWLRPGQEDQRDRFSIVS